MLWTKIVTLLVALGVQAQDRVVDLTPKTASDGRAPTHSNWRMDRVDCRGRSTGRIGPAPTLTLTVIHLDRSELSMASQFAADIRVTNTGTEPVILPSILAHEFGDGFVGGPYAVQASLGLEIVDAEDREHGVAGAVLRGSPSWFGTTESLAPGESLTIRFPGWTVGVDGPSAPITGDAQLFARLILSDNNCRDWNAVRSRRVNIRFRGRS
jgi:hypothetical protein